MELFLRLCRGALKSQGCKTVLNCFHDRASYLRIYCLLPPLICLPNNPDFGERTWISLAKGRRKSTRKKGSILPLFLSCLPPMKWNSVCLRMLLLHKLASLNNELPPTGPTLTASLRRPCLVSNKCLRLSQLQQLSSRQPQATNCSNSAQIRNGDLQPFARPLNFISAFRISFPFSFHGYSLTVKNQSAVGWFWVIKTGRF